LIELKADCRDGKTAMIFSYAVLSTMSRQKNENDEALDRANTPPPAENSS
jgi:hypothetical protein